MSRSILLRPKGGGTGGDGDMTKDVYDTNADGVVDTAEGVKSGASLPESASEGHMFFKTDTNELYVWHD